MPPKAPLRSNPHTFVNTIQTHLAAGIRQSAPAWLPALVRVPPTIPQTSSILPTETGAFIPENELPSAITASRKQSATRITHNPKRQKEVIERKPKKITYPEDEIRSAFYRWHPFELVRPTVLVETEGSIRSWEGKNWAEGLEGGVKGSEVTGESVVQYTRHLMSRAGGSLTRSEAYRKALSEFYTHRAAEENRERVARELLLKAEAEAEAAKAELAAAAAEIEEDGTSKSLEENDVSKLLDLDAFGEPKKIHIPGPTDDAKTKPVTAKFAAREDAQVQLGELHMKKRLDDRNERRLREDQASKYDLRNLKNREEMEEE
ncbi:mitochondrial ribosomal small subunit component [Borealophlyctis nickersoniae]|nr:mitochondrial ribosomal small subunit component [Borealophlyctis nickersoniae]